MLSRDIAQSLNFYNADKHHEAMNLAIGSYFVLFCLRLAAHALIVECIGDGGADILFYAGKSVIHCLMLKFDPPTSVKQPKEFPSTYIDEGDRRGGVQMKGADFTKGCSLSDNPVA